MNTRASSERTRRATVVAQCGAALQRHPDRGTGCSKDARPLFSMYHSPNFPETHAYYATVEKNALPFSEISQEDEAIHYAKEATVRLAIIISVFLQKTISTAS